MAKLHARVSMVIDVPKEKLREIMKLHEVDGDFDLNDIKGVDWSQAKPCDWDDGGYIPGSWLQYDLVDAGIVSVEEAEEKGWV